MPNSMARVRAQIERQQDNIIQRQRQRKRRQDVGRWAGLLVTDDRAILSTEDALVSDVM